MESAKFDRKTILIASKDGSNKFRANGSVVKFDGFLKLYKIEDENDKEKILPDVNKGKVNLENFDAIIAPEHDNLIGNNVYSSKGAIHYITELEISRAKAYLMKNINSEKIVSLILGGPNKYYSFDEDQLINIFKILRSI